MDLSYIILVVVTMLLGLGTQAYIQNKYKKWSAYDASYPDTGAAVAQRMLISGGADTVGITRVAGTLTDYYDPSDNCLHLSDDNYTGGSIASVAVACHEAGHAIQNATGYSLMRFRSQLVPVASFASNTWVIVFMIGVALNMLGLVQLAIILFAASVLFQIVTLPVEIDASKRALAYIEQTGSESDVQGAREVLVAAALTYVAAALSSILQLVYYAGIARGNNR